MRLAEDEKGLIRDAQDMIAICKASMGNRASSYRQYSQYIETGRTEGGLSLANTLYAHVDRLASHLFCPTDLRFTIDFENLYPKNILDMGEMASRVVTRDFERHNLDLLFGQAVWQGAAYGASIIKLGGKTELVDLGDGKQITHLKDVSGRIVPAWHMGVENEGRNSLTDQEAILETVYISKYDAWRRIAAFPDAEKLYKRIMAHADKSPSQGTPSSFVQILSTTQLNISPQGTGAQPPGGVVQMSGDPNYTNSGPIVISDQIVMHELWVKDDSTADWLMIQLIEPDILIAPRFKRKNEFCPGNMPYVLVQPNVVPGYLWGRSEIVDLIELQSALTETMDDFKRLIGVQYDKRYAFEGVDGDPQELYDSLRDEGWANMGQRGKASDVTPQLPAGALEYIKLLRETMDDVSGFGNILSGQGESGVRSGNHAGTLMKTASPRLRDRSLLVERQCATLADLYLSYMEAKDATQYYVNPAETDKTAFLLADLPDDRRVTVDSHRSSPIYENDHNNLVSFLLKGGLINGARALKMLNVPDRDEAIREWMEAQAAKQKFIQEHPEVLEHGRRGGAHPK